jgi:integrase/recombinase XerD
LQEYLKIRGETHGQLGITSRLFLTFRGAPLAQQTADRYFRLARAQAGVRRNDGAYYQPRLHDFRASFAVHRLVAWYRQGGDVQKLLPLLSTYLGHVGIDGTQVYLRMTPELLDEANRRFERYALSGSEVSHGR